MKAREPRLAQCSEGARQREGRVAPPSEAAPTGPIPCQPRGQSGPGPASDGAFWTWPWLLGHKEVAAARPLGKDPGLTAGPGEASSSKLPGVSRMRGQDRNILDRNYFFLGGEEPFGQEGKKHIPSSLSALKTSGFMELSGILSQLPIHPLVFLFADAFGISCALSSQPCVL